MKSLISVFITLTGRMVPIMGVFKKVHYTGTECTVGQLDNWTIAQGVTFRFKLTKEKILWENLTPQSGFSL